MPGSNRIDCLYLSQEDLLQSGCFDIQMAIAAAEAAMLAFREKRILFPEKIGGKYWMLRRPLQWYGPQYGCEHPSIWISSADDLLGFRDAKLLAKQEFDWEANKIGANTPPIKTKAVRKSLLPT